MINTNNMTVDEIRKLINDLQGKLNIYTKTKQAICNLIIGNKSVMNCPKCESTHIVKNGKPNGKQNYLCKNCNKKFNALTNTIFSGLNLTYAEVETIFDNIISCTPIRKIASLMNKSTKTIFTIRHKIMDCLSNILSCDKLSGEIELDELYLSINLKGTKKENMPRASKKRSSNGNGKRGISNHKICITSGIDDNDNLFLTIAGTSSVTSTMIEETVLPKIKEPSKIITDCKSSYESVAINNNWNLIQIKANGHVDKNGNNLGNINNIHQQVQLFLSRFRNVSSKHLQQYLDLFTFLKKLNWKYDYKEQSQAFRNKTCTLKSNISYKNVCDNHSILDFNEIYADYNPHPSNSTT